MAADVLVPDVTRSSAAMISNVCNVHTPSFLGVNFNNLPHVSTKSFEWCEIMIYSCCVVLFCFSENSAWQRLTLNASPFTYWGPELNHHSVCRCTGNKHFEAISRQKAAGSEPSHYLYQWSPSLLIHISSSLNGSIKTHTSTFTLYIFS